MSDTMDPITELMGCLDRYIRDKIAEEVASQEHKEFRKKITIQSRANLELALRYAIAKRTSSTQITAIRIEKDKDPNEEG